MQAPVVNLLDESDDRARVGISLPLPGTLSSDLNVQGDCRTYEKTLSLAMRNDHYVG